MTENCHREFFFRRKKLHDARMKDPFRDYVRAQPTWIADFEQFKALLTAIEIIQQNAGFAVPLSSFNYAECT